MKYLILLIALLGGLSGFAFAQTSEDRDVSDFNRIIVSEGIDLELQEGPQEELTLHYQNIDPKDIIVDISRKRINIYLRDCKNGCRFDYGKNPYQDSEVKAFLTYKTIKSLTVKGENEVIAGSPIEAKKFKLYALGESDIWFESLEADKFKASLFGTSKVAVVNGEVGVLRLRSFGENIFTAVDMPCASGKISSFGENNFDLTIYEEMKVTVFGESKLQYFGTPEKSRKLVFGALTLNHL